MQYGAAICRLCYYRAPGALPDEGDPEGQARYWKRYYNTPLGAGTVEKYIAEAEETPRASYAQAEGPEPPGLSELHRLKFRRK